MEIITLACITLHNYLITENAIPYADIGSIENFKKTDNELAKQGGNKSTVNVRAIRNEFQEFFCSEVGSVDWQENAISRFNM